MREFTLQFSKRTFDWFVVTQPTIKTEDGYTTRVIEISALENLRADNQRLRESFSILKAKVSDLQNHYHTDIFSDYDLKTNPKPSIDQVAAKMGRHLCGVFLLQIDEALSESEASKESEG